MEDISYQLFSLIFGHDRKKEIKQWVNFYLVLTLERLGHVWTLKAGNNKKAETENAGRRT